jgi:hypothetical protein
MCTIFGPIGKNLASISNGYHRCANIDYGFSGIETPGDQQSNLTSNRTKCARNESTIIQTFSSTRTTFLLQINQSAILEVNNVQDCITDPEANCCSAKEKMNNNLGSIH